MEPTRPRVLLGLTGSVATVKWPELVLALRAFAEVKVVVTAAAEHFLRLAEGYNPAAWAAVHALAPPVPLLRDADEWATYARVKEDAVLHIELRKWADVFLIAPLSANSLAKLAGGHADNLLTCVARAWDFSPPPPPPQPGSAPARPHPRLVAAPAMNTAMWAHPVTAGQLDTLRGWGVVVVPPAVKALACGDVGTGALARVEDIVAAVRAALAPTPPPPAAAAPPSAAATSSDDAAAPENRRTAHAIECVAHATVHRSFKQGLGACAPHARPGAV